MSDASRPTLAAAVAQTAERIFVALLHDAVVLGQDSAKMKASPDSLARLSFELSKAFHKVEVEHNEAAPKALATFDIKPGDFDDWAKGSPTK